MEILESPNDKDHDGIDDYTDIYEGAKQYILTNPSYRSKYYEGGYPTDGYGVCTDVIWRAFKSAGYDLKILVDDDIQNNLKDYTLIQTPDPNIYVNLLGFLLKGEILMKKIKLVSICCIIILVIVLACIIINALKDSNSKVTYEETVSPEPGSEFYTIPNGYSIKHSDEVKYEDYLYKGKERAATIDINPNSDYSLELSSIVTNWIGESAYIKNDVEEKNYDSYKRYKALISFEKSAAQEEKGKSLPDQLHYFYVKDNLLLDLSLDLNYIDEESAMLIANTIELK